MGCRGGLCYGDGEVTKSLCDLVRRIAVSVASAFAEESDRLISFKDADCDWVPSETVPVEVTCGGDDDPDSFTFRGEVFQVVKVFYVVEDEEVVCRIC